MSEFTLNHSFDNDYNLDSKLDLDAFDVEGPLTPLLVPETYLYRGPFNSLQAAYNWCQE
jgi:hypothetical protein